MHREHGVPSQDFRSVDAIPAHGAFPERDIEQSIASRFERQVDTYPNHIAIKAADRVLTYHGLNREANRVAQTILAARGDLEEPIALLVEPGPAAIVMLLGVLKAGKFYVPLDASHPPARLRAVLRDAQPALLLTNTTHHDLATEIAEMPCQVVNSDALDPFVSERNPDLALSADRIGYLFYTSGSTGSPKGVTHRQRSILHQIRIYSNELRIGGDDRVTLLHSHAFSASRLDIFGALLNGAALCPFSVVDGGIPQLIRWLEAEALTISQWIPTLFRHVANAVEDGQQFPHLRAIVLGSEPVLPRDVELFQQHFSPHCRLVNRFGTTETGNVRWAFFSRDSIVPIGVVPVGMPIPGADVLLIDAEGARIAPGEIGEICVQSRYLSPGYWKNPVMTATKFLPDPQGGDARIYRTGDLGRLRLDGTLEHLGRMDAQVKIRGFRVETQEVEARLSQHPTIQACVVDVVTHEDGDGRLTAWVVLVPGGAVSTEALRRYVSETLPPYMVPSAVIVLEALPQTPHGKVDRRALTTANLPITPPHSAVAAPTDITQQRVLRIWAEVLGILALAITDNFFDLGGNSLLAALIMVRVKRTFGRQLSPTEIFRAPTVAQFAELLRKPHDEAPWPSLVPVQPTGNRPPFFWVHGDASSAFLPAYLGPDQPVYGLEHQSQDGRPAAHTRVETIAAHYLTQMRTVRPDGPYLLGGYSFGGVIAFEIAQQLSAQGERVALLVLLDSLFPGSLDRAATPTEDAPCVPAASPPSVRVQLESHFRTLTSLSLREQWDYLRIRLRARFDAMIGYRAGLFVRRRVCAVYLRLGWILPSFVRSRYILDIYRRALDRYVPKALSGRVVYFKTVSRSASHQAHWTTLLRDGIETYEVPGSHMEMIRKENLGAWAERLACCVSQAQSQVASPQGSGSLQEPSPAGP